MAGDPSFGGGRPAAVFPPVPAGRTAEDLAQFWADYEPIVARSARSRLRRLDIPESLASFDDVAQDVYLDVAKRWSKLEQPGKYTLGCSLRTVIRRVQREQLRRAGVLIDDGQERLSQMADEGPGPEDVVLDQLVDAQLLATLQDAWEQLSDREQAAVELTVLKGASRTETAETMGVATGTVSSHRTRGLTKLRGALVTSGGLVVYAMALEHFGLAVVLAGLALVVATVIGLIGLSAGSRRAATVLLSPVFLAAYLSHALGSPAKAIGFAIFLLVPAVVILVGVAYWRDDGQR